MSIFSTVAGWFGKKAVEAAGEAVVEGAVATVVPGGWLISFLTSNKWRTAFLALLIAATVVGGLGYWFEEHQIGKLTDKVASISKDLAETTTKYETEKGNRERLQEAIENQNAAINELVNRTKAQQKKIDNLNAKIRKWNELQKQMEKEYERMENRSASAEEAMQWLRKQSEKLR